MGTYDTTRQLRSSKWRRFLVLSAIGLIVAVIFISIITFSGLLIFYPGVRASMSAFTQALFALNSVQVWWYITRAAGIVAYLLLWLSTAWGLAVSSKIFDPLLHRLYTYDFHEFISLLAIGFLVLHMVVLTLDHYQPFSWLQILVPFIAPYRPIWIGVGVIAFYLTLLVTVTFYIRQVISNRAFRWIHVLSLVAFLGAALHGIYAGTDSPLASMQIIYKGSLLSIVFLTVFWLVTLIQKKRGGSRRPELLQDRKAPV